jgi:hypothetical protein
MATGFRRNKDGYRSAETGGWESENTRYKTKSRRLSKHEIRQRGGKPPLKHLKTAREWRLRE